MLRGWKAQLVTVCLIVVGALVTAAAAWAVTGSWGAPGQLDRGHPVQNAAADLVCPSDGECVGIASATLGPGIYAFRGLELTGVNSWPLTTPFGSGDNYVDLTTLQCPSADLCVGTADYASDEDDTDDVVASTTPAAGASSWVQQNVENPPSELSCPTTTLCVGAGEDGGIDASTNPAGGAGAWGEVTLAHQIVDVDCPGATFCAAIDAQGDVWTTTDPSGPAGAWTESGAAAPLTVAATSDAQGDVNNSSCSGPTLCVAAGADGQVLVSTNPSGSSAWTAVAATAGEVHSVYCVPGGSLCLAGDGRGDIATTTDAQSTTPWTSTPTPGDNGTGADGQIRSISCSAGFCVASGTVPVRAQIPMTGGAWHWQLASDLHYDALSSVSCPGTGLCIGADTGHYFESADPAGGVSSWKVQVDDDEYHDHDAGTLDTACASARLCFAATDDIASGGLADLSGGQLYRFDPAGGVHGLADVAAGDDNTLYVACAQGTCVSGYPGDWRQSTDPASNRSWKQIAAPRFDVTCLKGNAACVALADGPFIGTAGPDLLVAARRGGPWRTQSVDPANEITGLACTSRGVCVIVDEAGRLLVSTQPTRGPSSWTVADTDADGFNGVACQTATRCVAVDSHGGVVVGRP